MKRSGPPARKTPLARTALRRAPAPPKTSGRGTAVKTTPSPTKAARRVVRLLEPGEAEWKRKRTGTCGVCGDYGRIVWHHVVDKNTLKRLGQPQYDPRDALPIGAPPTFGGRCPCHDDHTYLGIGEKKIAYEKIPVAARKFAVETLGEGPALEYFRRHYGGAP